MRSWKIVDGSPLLDAKRLRSIWASKTTEAFVRNTCCACNKSQKLEPVFEIKLFDVLPEEFYCIVGVVITSSIF